MAQVGKYWVGKKFTKEHKRKISEGIKNNLPRTAFKKGQNPPNLQRLIQNAKDNPPRRGVKLSDEVRQRISRGRKGKMTGISHYLWIQDRTLLKKSQYRNDPAYREWVSEIKKRDKQCQLKDENCSGYLVVHHIKPWRDNVELRYELNNGITLCQAHHPKRRAEEIQLIPKLMALIANNV